jgi:hypothetical protein
MWDLLLFALAALCLVAVICWAIYDAADWLDHRSYQRSKYIARQVAKTQERLTALSDQRTTLLNARTHEAAVALILASFQASIESGEAPSDQGRCQ